MRAFLTGAILIAFPMAAIAQTAPTPATVAAPASAEAVRGTSGAASEAANAATRTQGVTAPAGTRDGKDEKK